MVYWSFNFINIDHIIAVLRILLRHLINIKMDTTVYKEYYSLCVSQHRIKEREKIYLNRINTTLTTTNLTKKTSKKKKLQYFLRWGKWSLTCTYRNLLIIPLTLEHLNNN